MKKIIICLLLSLFLLACVPTPEQEFIVNKGEEKDWQRPVEIVTVPGGTQDTSGVPQNENEFVPNQPTDTETPTESALYETLGAPQYWALDTEINGVRVVAEDAPVILPMASRAPAAEAKTATFTEDMLNRAAAAMFGKQPIAWYDAGTTTKEQLAERIRYWQDLLPTAEDESHSEYWAQCLKECTEAYDRVPSESDLSPIPLVPGTYTEDWGKPHERNGLVARAEIGGTEWILTLDQNYGNELLKLAPAAHPKSNDILAETSYGGHPILDEPWGVTLTKGDAIAEGNSIVQAIDENYTLCFCGPAAARFADEQGIPRLWGWGLVYMRQMNGFPSAYASREIGDRLDDDDTDIPPYERLFLVIDDEGPAYLEWQTPMEITRILGADQSLLSFDEAFAHAKNMIVAHWKYELDRDPGSFVKIDKVKLGLQRIAKKGGGFYFVPAYFYYLDIVDTEAYRQKTDSGWENFYRNERARLERNNGVVDSDALGYFREYNVVVINALDGTVIDLGKGF